MIILHQILQGGFPIGLVCAGIVTQEDIALLNRRMKRTTKLYDRRGQRGVGVSRS
jgi:hypothetical protein